MKNFKLEIFKYSKFLKINENRFIGESIIINQ